MKKLIIVAAIISGLAFTARKFTTSQASAEVNQVQGCYIFIDSKPVSNYDYLGTVQKGAMDVIFKTGSGQYQDIRDKLIKEVKKKFPKANGIIFDFHDGGEDKADAILIK